MTEFVPLKGGPIVDAEALRVMHDLEHRGFVLSKRGNDLVVTNGAQLTITDRAAIARYKDDLLQIVAYQPPELGKS